MSSILQSYYTHANKRTFDSNAILSACSHPKLNETDRMHAVNELLTSNYTSIDAAIHTLEKTPQKAQKNNDLITDLKCARLMDLSNRKHSYEQTSKDLQQLIDEEKKRVFLKLIAIGASLYTIQKLY